MKAPSSGTSEEEGADESEALDYCEFFSILMYYGHMSKESIMNSSRPFLYGVYRKYAKRACENLGISSDNDREESDETIQLNEESYPTEFYKISDMDRVETMNALTNNADFMQQFGDYI